MYLLVNVLEQTDRLPVLLEEFVNIGVTGSTIIDSIGMGRILLESETDAPVIKVIKEALDQKNSTNKTIFAVIPNKQTLDQAINVVKSISGDLNELGKGILFTLSVDFVEGLKK
mgnify:FL=1